MATTPSTKQVLTKAAKMRDAGATWNAIREATGTKLGSSAWFRAWEREGIKHAPAGEKPPSKPKPAKATATKPTPARAKKPARNVTARKQPAAQP